MRLLALLSLVGPAVAPLEARNSVTDGTGTSQLWLPIVLENYPCPIGGTMTLNSAPVSVTLRLLQFDSPKKAYVDTTQSGADGRFCFPEVPLLSPCTNGDLGYAVVFGYDLPVPNRAYLRGWQSRVLPRCTPDQIYPDLHTDLADITVVAPSDGVTVTIPITFSWTYPGPQTGFFALSFPCAFFAVGITTTYTMKWAQPPCVVPGQSANWY